MSIIVSFRNVTLQDCNLVFNWANDEEVRENSFNTNVIQYEDHVNWFEERLMSPNTQLKILQVNGHDVGIVRLERMNETSILINYSIDKNHRGKGYATTLLRMIKTEYYPLNLIGKVKAHNIGSIKAFQKADYSLKQSGEIIEFHSTSSIEEG